MRVMLRCMLAKNSVDIMACKWHETYLTFQGYKISLVLSN